VDPRDRMVISVKRTPHGGAVGDERLASLDEGRPGDCPEPEWREMLDDLALIDHAGADLDRQAIVDGRQTPVFFGSALTNLGVRRLLEGFAAIAPSPRPAAVDGDGPARSLEAPFSGFVFKIQANTDPRHRDRIAFLRVVSGRFRRGMSATNARTGRGMTLRFAHELFGRERATIDDAVPGDIVGIVNATGVLVGDTLYEDEAVSYPPIPTFAPERFVRVRNLDTNRYKRFRTGLVHLDEEGVVHVLRRPNRGDQEPILAAVGDLQFEVARYRLETEFGCPVHIEPAPWIAARRVEGSHAGISGYGVDLVEDSRGNAVALFRSPTVLARLLETEAGARLLPVGIDAADPLAGLIS
jgi:peptide chain release factor 3